MKVILALAILLLSLGSYGQVPIDGSQNPSEIPTEVILRFWMNMMTYPEKGVTSAVPYQLHDLSSTGLTVSDQQVLGSILTNYRVDMNGFVLNDLTEDSFWKDELALVGSTWTTIQNQLSASGLVMFTNYLNQQKTGLTLSPFDYGLGTTAELARKEYNMSVSMGHSMPQAAGMTPNYSELESLSVTVNPEKTDTFNSNGVNITTQGWTVPYGGFAQTTTELYANTGGGASGKDATAIYTSGTHPVNNGCVITTLNAPPRYGNSVGPGLRMDLSHETYYTAGFYGTSTGGVPAIQLYKVVNGVSTGLGGVSYTGAIGDILSLCGHGSTLTVMLTSATNGYYNHVPFTATDTSITSGYNGIVSTVDSSELNYAGAVSYWVGDVDPTIVITNTVSGTSTCSGCGTPFHTPNTTVGSNSNSGTPEHPTTFIESQTSGSYTLSSFFTTPTVTYTGWVDCSALGPLWTGPGGTDGPTKHGFQSERAWTWYNETSWSSTGGGTAVVTPICAVSSTPPDFNHTPLSPVPNAPAFYSSALVYRWQSSGPWTYEGVLNVMDPPYTHTLTVGAPCTYKDGGVTGSQVYP